MRESYRTRLGPYSKKAWDWFCLGGWRSNWQLKRSRAGVTRSAKRSNSSSISSPGSMTPQTEPLHIDDLEDTLNEAMLSLNTMTEDGSIEEVAEKLMIMYEDCLDCNFNSIESLREANQRKVALPHVREVANDDDGDSDEDDDDRDHSMGNDDSSNMMVHIPEAHSNLNPVNVSGNEPKLKPAAEAEDGWEVVGPRKHRGKRN